MKNKKMSDAFPKVSERFHNAVVHALEELPQQKESNNMMKKLSLKKSLAIAAAAIFVLSAAVFAAGKVVNHVSHSNAYADYKSMPTQEQCIKDIGYAPEMLDKFSNGYEFESATIVHNDLQDENNKSVEKYDSLSADYRRDNNSVYYSADKKSSDTEEYGEIIGEINGISVYCNSYMNKFVPPDYKMTEQDKKDEEEGIYVFSYGSSEVEITKIQDVHWEKDGIDYQLMTMDGDLTEQELFDMAKELITK